MRAGKLPRRVLLVLMERVLAMPTLMMFVAAAK
jgi:hypothetical protein